ncbi:MAG: hypothetical protein RBT66_09715 [bacterium]|nr:hypothetical protein [bacterium]
MKRFIYSALDAMESMIRNDGLYTSLAYSMKHPPVLLNRFVGQETRFRRTGPSKAHKDEGRNRPIVNKQGISRTNSLKQRTVFIGFDQVTKLRG